MEDLYSAFCRTVDRFGMFDGADSVLIGLSGGADSVVLTDLLVRYRAEHSLTLSALHLHHGIRGAEADRDAAFCTDLCRKYNIPLTLAYADIPALAQQWGLGTEETARTERHRILEKTRVACQADRIVLAHNANDVLETMLFRLARGTTGDGLCGISPIGDRIVRPLIELTRRQIEAYAADRGLEYVHDSSNDDTQYTRNYIRSEIVPRLLHVNENAVQNAARCAISLYEDRELLRAVSDSGNMTEQTAQALLRRRIVRFCYAAGTGALGAVHADAIVRLLQNGKTGQSVSLPGQKTAVRSPKGFYITENTPCATVGFDIPADRGRYVLPNGGELLIRPAEKDIKAATIIYKLAIHATIDFDRILGQVRICSRNRKDTLCFGGVHHAVRKLVQSEDLSPAVRAILPVLRDDDGVLWLPTAPVRDGCRGTGQPNVFFFCNPPIEFLL